MFINFITVTIVTYLHSFHLQFCTLAETMIKIFKRIHRLLIHRHIYSRYNNWFVLVIKAWVFFFIALQIYKELHCLKYHHSLIRIYYQIWQCKKAVCLPFAAIKYGPVFQLDFWNLQDNCQFYKNIFRTFFIIKLIFIKFFRRIWEIGWQMFGDQCLAESLLA